MMPSEKREQKKVLANMIIYINASFRYNTHNKCQEFHAPTHGRKWR